MNWITRTKNIFSGIYFVGYTAGVISFEYAKYSANSALKLFGQSTSTSSPYVNMVKNIAARLSKKNIYYTKMFQALAYSSEIYDDDLASFFIQYTDAVHYEDSEYSNDYLNQVVEFADKTGYDLTISSKVRNGKYIPDKTGSVSLIFYGTLTNHDANDKSKSMPVVIKYLRSNMLPRIKSAINDVSYMVSILNLFPQFKHLYLDEILSEQKKMMLSQVNFHTEVENILKMYDNFQKTNTSIIKIPVVFKEFTDEFENIILMERIVGRKLEELPNELKDEYCKILAKGLIKTVFLDGFYHCDMHPGNVLFIENEHEHGQRSTIPRLQVAILDFGIMSSISTRDQNLSYDIFRSVLNKNSKSIAKIFVEGFIEPCDNIIHRQPSYDNDDICNTLDEVISDILKDKTLTCFTAKDLCAMNYAILKYNMKVSKSLTNFEISLSVCDNLCKKIAFNRTYMDQLKDIVDDMFD